MTDLDARLRGRKLEQSCPNCARWEAAGPYCTGCLRPMLSSDWYRNGDVLKRSLSRQDRGRGARTPAKRSSPQGSAMGSPRRSEPPTYPGPSRDEPAH